MPLTELMNYFNEQLQLQARTKSLPPTGFYKAGKTYGARFGGITFSSRFTVLQNPKNNTVIGHAAEFSARSQTGRIFTSKEIFQTLDSTDQIIHLDRLTRTLHSLNYLQRYDGNETLLCLNVQPRHIISVPTEHGKTFEGILSDCGLGPERVLVRTQLKDVATLPHFRQALTSYRDRGYKTGIDLQQPRDSVLFEQLALEPDFIFFEVPGAVRITTPKKQGLQLHWLDPLHQYRNARRIIVGTKAALQDLEVDQFDGSLVLSDDIIDSHTDHEGSPYTSIVETSAKKYSNQTHFLHKRDV